MKNIQCTLAYCGTHYLGFQKTKMGPSIEQTVQEALEKILQHPIQLQAASRTDQGVHAEGQVINFFSNITDLGLLHESLRSLLPSDIAPLHLDWAPEDFHPTLDNKGKEYHYLICNSPTQIPFHRDFSWHFYSPLDLELMKQAAQTLKGTHDFSAFSPITYDNSVRHIEKIEALPLENQRLLLKIQGDNFLYKMVRNIVGTLAYIGSGKLSNIHQILESKDRKQAGITAPAHGLYLKQVFY